MPHPTRLFFAFLCLVYIAFPQVAGARTWKSADGLRTVEGEFLERDATFITIRLNAGKETRFEITKLHADDQKWLNLNHPAAGAEIIPDHTAVFDTLNFGDSQAVVLAKLKASKFVELTIAPEMLARTGLNGIFRIRQAIGGLQASLYFDWTTGDKLNEITVRTSTFPVESYDAKITPCWKEFTELLTTLHGKPLQAAARIAPASVPKGALISSHLWRLESGGSALLGIGNEDDSYQVVVRFTDEKIEPVIIARPSKPGGIKIDFNP
ncbi:MAG: hypothetical protein WEB53_09740 [Akkermansiaceae bacterium]